jgi:hypothetical protein
MDEEKLPTKAQVAQYKMLDDLLNSVYIEMKEFSKKKPDEPLNKFKVKNVNRVLEQIKEILVNEPTLQFLDTLDDDALPSNSDAILVIAQFKASMERFQKRYYIRTGSGSSSWNTRESPIKRGQF